MQQILVIDDEKPTLGMFKLFLSAYGYQVLTAENGEDGLAAFEEHRPSIVLTDIKMPQMDGIQVLTRIKELAPLTEVIVITGHGDIDLAIEALNLDATDFLHKPIQRKDLEAALARAGERLGLTQNEHSQASFQQNGSCGVLRVRGNLTSGSEAHLRRIFAQAQNQPLVLFFQDSASVNGAGLTILGELLSQRQAMGAPTAICGLSSNFRQVFDALGLTAAAPIHQTLEAAIASLSG